MDFLFPSAGTYKINLLINDVSLDDCSFIRINDEIRPYFEESISDDPDVNALMVFLRDFRGETIGSRIIYGLEHDDYYDDDVFILVKSLDGSLPKFPIPDDLQKGRYTFVSQVMSGRNILQRTEKSIYYLSSNYFNYEGINVYLPGIAESPHLIPKETVIMLEVKLEYESSIDPYIIWYEGRRKIGEGKISEGAGQQFWKAPDQSGFFSLRAEIFPAANIDGLTGYHNGISLLVSSMAIDVHLVSQDIPQLIKWYTFEGDLNDSRTMLPALNPPIWKGAENTYGIVTGYGNIMTFPKTDVHNMTDTWQMLFRFKPVNDGSLFTVQFGSSHNAVMLLSLQEDNLILTLSTNSETVSKTKPLPKKAENGSSGSFITAGIKFSFLSGVLSAHINILDTSLNGELTAAPIIINTVIEDDFQIILGIAEEESSPVYTALWDELALYYMPPMEILFSVNPLVSNNDYLQN